MWWNGFQTVETVQHDITGKIGVVASGGEGFFGLSCAQIQVLSKFKICIGLTRKQPIIHMAQYHVSTGSSETRATVAYWERL